MSDIKFIFYSLMSRKLNTFLSILLTSFGVSIALLISQFSEHIDNRLKRDGKNIDIVVGAKGSPLQLVLSSLFHIDIPTGNIPYDKAKNIMKHSQVKTAIPLALGDNWKGYRIVGTSYDYLRHYDAEVNLGKLWEKNFEVVVGSSVNLNINQQFVGSHGIIEGGSSHDNEKYSVVGELKETGSVLDRLILTSVDSVLSIHELEHLNHVKIEENSEHGDSKISQDSHDSKHFHDPHDSHDSLLSHDSHHSDNSSEKNKSQQKKIIVDKEKGTSKVLKTLNSPEITAVLLTTKSPVANINLPRKINSESSLLAANPALEITRLISIFGFGSKSYVFFSFLLILIAILTIFSGLASNLENRLSDLAVLRAIGYSKNRIFKIISLECFFIVSTGIIIGTLLGVLGFNFLSDSISSLEESMAKFRFSVSFFSIIISIFFVGILAGIFPAYQGSRVSVAEQLSRKI